MMQDLHSCILIMRHSAAKKEEKKSASAPNMT